MSKGAKKSGRIRRQRPKRPERRRKSFKTILIVCEGEKTEPQYFDSFRQKLHKNTVQITIKGAGRNTISLVKYAEKIVMREGPFDHVWCVFDRDGFKPKQINQAFCKIQELNKPFKGKDVYRIAFSNEAFELWYLLHFDHTVTGYTRDQLSDKLDTKLGYKYKKNDPGMYDKLLGRQKVAIRRAKKLYHDYEKLGESEPFPNPSTTVYKLVEKLNEEIEKANSPDSSNE